MEGDLNIDKIVIFRQCNGERVKYQVHLIAFVWKKGENNGDN